MCASTLSLDTESRVGLSHRCGDVDAEEPLPSSLNPVLPSPAGGKVSFGNDSSWPEWRAWEGGREGGQRYSQEDRQIQRARGVQSLHVHPVREEGREG